jgi:hypothetical protein
MDISSPRIFRSSLDLAVSAVLQQHMVGRDQRAQSGVYPLPGRHPGPAIGDDQGAPRFEELAQNRRHAVDRPRRDVDHPGRDVVPAAALAVEAPAEQLSLEDVVDPRHRRDQSTRASLLTNAPPGTNIDGRAPSIAKSGRAAAQGGQHHAHALRTADSRA